ncbi:redoxin domain-containing protein [Sphingobacterium sp. SRCM116780]|uniref:TlpA family protein disulfide reductase n=1 Tax=Sphingobacterium sp. SRCM116780 TaxID=2907623 RepID=UPI001F1687EC|nr:redoxin domain-containing protein [Sphingobacterium sp. SRCM116780]UIR57950.1 redoxin domain-containing protein [Sphingobacterium sp. SRCM116780]
MNKKLILGITGIFTASLLFSCNSNNKTQQTADTTTHDEHEAHDHSNHDHSAHTEAPTTMLKEVSKTLPDFTFYQLKSGIKVSKSDISKDKNNIFVLFDPGCSHCQQEAIALEKNIARLKDVNIYYVSMNDPALILGFFDNFAPKLSKLDNVEILVDKNQEFIQKIHVPNQFPANYVYGADGQLKAHWEGDKNINEAIAEFHK